MLGSGIYLPLAKRTLPLFDQLSCQQGQVGEGTGGAGAFGGRISKVCKLRSAGGAFVLVWFCFGFALVLIWFGVLRLVLCGLSWGLVRFGLVWFVPSRS